MAQSPALLCLRTSPVPGRHNGHGHAQLREVDQEVVVTAPTADIAQQHVLDVTPCLGSTFQDTAPSRHDNYAGQRRTATCVAQACPKGLQ